MGLDTNKLEKVKHVGQKIIARCPACAKEGHDQTGDHLFIEPSGKFGCIVYPGIEGTQHRKKIFKLVGIRNSCHKIFSVRMPVLQKEEETIPNILGRLGHLSSTYVRSVTKEIFKEVDKESKTTVPDVPELSSFTYEEKKLLTGIGQKDLKQIAEIKRIFNGKIVHVTDKTLMI